MAGTYFGLIPGAGLQLYSVPIRSTEGRQIHSCAQAWVWWWTSAYALESTANCAKLAT